jgi:hypothetical protein
MIITTSPDLSLLLLNVTWDISGTLPVISVTNLSQGPNLQNITYWIQVQSPSTTPIHEGSLAQPDAVGVWSTLSLTDSWPRPFSQLEWSGAPYSFTIFAQDSTGTVYQDSSYGASICRPAGNNNLSKTFYGVSNTNVQLQCQQASIYFQDQTNASYQGLTGTLLSSVLRLVYPIDDTGNIPTPFVIQNFSSASAPISYSSDNYQFQTQLVYQYQLSSNVFLNIRYQTINPKNQTNYITFPVLCNIDLSPLVCEYEKLIDSLERGTCSDVQDTERKLLLINPKMALIGMGLLQPLTGINVPRLVREVEELGGFSCDCCNAPSGIIPQTSSTIDGYTFSIVPVCGDISGTVTISGTNVQLNLQDKSYVFALNGAIPTTSFTITPSTVNCVKTFTFNINLTQFATDLLNTIKTNGDLVNLFNTIVVGGVNLMISADGKCVYTSASSFNYTFTLTNIPSNTTFSILTQVTNGSAVQNLNFSFNLTNLTALQTYLNSLNIGTFVVTNPTGQTVQIVSASNPNNLSILTYSISSTSYIANQATSAAGYIPISANQVIQNIINYLCGITDGQITTSQPYAISYIGSNGVPQTVTVAAGSTLANFLSTLVNLQDQTVDNLGGSVGVTCANIQSQFPVSQKPFTATDFIYVTKNGVCAQGNILDVFNYMLTSGFTDATTKTNFCNFVESCGAGLTCGPYVYFEAIVTTYNSACSEIVGIQYSLS